MLDFGGPERSFSTSVVHSVFAALCCIEFQVTCKRGQGYPRCCTRPGFAHDQVDSQIPHGPGAAESGRIWPHLQHHVANAGAFLLSVSRHAVHHGALGLGALSLPVFLVIFFTTAMTKHDAAQWFRGYRSERQLLFLRRGTGSVTRENCRLR